LTKTFLRALPRTPCRQGVECCPYLHFTLDQFQLWPPLHFWRPSLPCSTRATTCQPLLWTNMTNAKPCRPLDTHTCQIPLWSILPCPPMSWRLSTSHWTRSCQPLLEETSPPARN
jgi:hypothetical protein